MRASCDKRWKFSAAHFQISDLTGALVRGDTEHNETKRQHFRKLSERVEKTTFTKIEQRLKKASFLASSRKIMMKNVILWPFNNRRENQSCVVFSLSFSNCSSSLSFSNFSSFFSYFSSFSSFSIFSSSSYYCQTKGEGIAREAIGRGEERLLRPYFAFIATFVGTFTRYKNPAGFIAIF